MGKFHIATINDPGDSSTWKFEPGSTLDDVLDHVHYKPTQIQQDICDLIHDAINAGRISQSDGDDNQRFFSELANSYTYLADERASQPEV